MERLSVEEIKYLKQKMQSNMNVYFYDEVMKVFDELISYRDDEEQGLLLRLPCDYNESLFWVVNGNIKEVWFKGIRCDKGYKPQIIARYLEGLSSKEEPITKLENIGKTVFLTKEEAGKTLAERKNDE